MAQLTDEIAARVMGEIHVVVVKLEQQQERVEALAAQVAQAAESVNRIKTGIHSVNEQFLIQEVKKIQAASAAITSFQQPIVKAAAEALCEPLVGEIRKLRNEWSERGIDALRFMNGTQELQKQIASAQQKAQTKSDEMRTYAWLAAFLVVALAFAAGRFLR